VFDPETVTFLESGCALIVAAVSPDGQPRASRGWGLGVTDTDTGHLRLILAADDLVTEEYLLASRQIAITGTSVLTLRSIQCKGKVVALEPATEVDLERVDAYCDAFFADVTTSDGVPRELLERMRPSAFVACLALTRQCFNQTPGPGAGAPLSTGTS
jgi:hypothetical protein